jgi:acetyl esterase/lipase
VPGSLAPYLTAPNLFLAFSVIAVLFALNAYRPLARRGPLSLSAFFASWLTSELPIHHIAWQVIAIAVFAWFGALRAWPGWVGLGLTLLSWTALVRLLVQGNLARVVMESALTETLGPDYAKRIELDWLARLDIPPRFAQSLRPFSMRHPEVERIADLSYGEHGRRNQLDIYRRRGAAPGCPVLIQVHGGGWVVGRKDQQGLPLMNHLASLGWVCVAINYRLSPRATFPDHIIDVKRAIAWVKANIAKYGGDPDFVVIAGGSAGGHLSSLAALTPDYKEYQPGFEDADTSVRACVPFYGVFDFTNRDGVGRSDLRILLERIIIKRRFKEAREIYERASPLYNITDRAPPFFVVHGTNDILAPVAEARLFVKALRATSREKVVYAEIPGAQHAFEVFASVRAAHVIRGVARFLTYIYSEYRRELAAAPRQSGAPVVGLKPERAELQAPEPSPELTPELAPELPRASAG